MINLIPVPAQYELKNGAFVIRDGEAVCSDFELPLLTCPRDENARIKITKDNSLQRENYRLTVEPEQIKIVSSTEIGAYYALQSVRVMASYDAGGRSVSCCEIKDEPRWGWRGLSLDESRHFFGKEEVRRILDMMFMMKLNTFHWHLTDDQGWRVEIKKYPLLTSIGSKRKYTQEGGWNCSRILNEPYEGFYTQDDIREIEAYAKARGITIVPEIDMPAHFAAAMAAYPWLACREIETEVPGYFGSKIPEKAGQKDWNRTACVGKETTFEFIFGVLDEICELFDSPYFHIGGDEAPKDEWKKCPLCQAKIKEHNLKDEEELQGWFNNRILNYVKGKGKRLIGWNEILTAGNLDKSVIGQYWTPKRDKNAEAYVADGGNMIMSNHRSFYFDMTYSQYPLQYTYDFSLSRYNIQPQCEKNILGVEAEMWTEWIDGREKLEVNLYPRMQALAEVAWSPEKRRNFADFKERLDAFKPTLDSLGIGYAVDKVSMPKGLFNRLKAQKLFFCGDTHYEVKRNADFRQKGEK